MRVGTGLTLLLGGARSGKSDLAVELGRSHAPGVTFVATAEALDDDMSDRIEQHRLDRPADWALIENARFGADDVAEVADDHLLILDCLTLLISNLLLAEQPIDAHVSALAHALARRHSPTVVVSNEVGMGVHPPSELGRVYRDELGRANRIMADAADDALLIVAGRALRLESIDTGLSFE